MLRFRYILLHDILVYDTMGRYLKAVRNTLPAVVDELYALYPDTVVRLAAIVYKDIDPNCDDLSQRPIERIDFTTDTCRAQDFLESIKPEGGGDIPEDMFAGLDELLRLSWVETSTRLAFVIADAPCHGSRFHPFPDSFPEEPDPHGLTCENILSGLDNLSIHLYFPYINATTMQMIGEFQRTNLLNTVKGIHFDDGEEELKQHKLVTRLQAIIKDEVSDLLTTSIRISWKMPEDRPFSIDKFEVIRCSRIDGFEDGRIFVAPSDHREFILTVPVAQPFTVRVRAVLSEHDRSGDIKKFTTALSNTLETIIDSDVSDSLFKYDTFRDATGHSEKPEISVLLNISAICDEEAANEVGQGNAQLVRDAWLQGLEALNTSNGGIDSEKSWLMFGHDKLPGSCLQLPTDLAHDHGHPEPQIALCGAPGEAARGRPGQAALRRGGALGPSSPS